jgi:SagB-type dehydrogenase family enzyme
MAKEIGVSPETWIKIDPPDAWSQTITFAETVFRRRSRRNFVGHTLPESCIQAILESLCISDSESGPVSAGHQQFFCTGFITNRVEGFESGFYLLDPVSASYGLIARNFPMDKMAHICLDQMWLSNASIHFLFMTNLQTLDQTWGARGYRYAMMAAGRMGERLYLAAEAMGLGACGIGALYDYEAAEALGLNNESRLLYLVAVGTVKAKVS